MLTLGDVASQLQATGYRIVPERERVPLVKGWNRNDGWQFDAATALPQHVAADCGIVCGRFTHVYVIDCDIDDEAVSLAFERHVRGITGFDDAPVRVGRAPRWAMLVQGDTVDLQSFSTPRWRSPRTGREVRVEFLGAGRKITAYGRHAKSGEAYTWRGGMAPHEGRAVHTLPEITAPMVKGMFDALEQMMREDFGEFEIVEEAKRPWTLQLVDEDGTPSMLGLAPRIGTPIAEAIRALQSVELDTRDTWLNAGMAMHHEYDGAQAAFDAWHLRSSQCRGYKGLQDCRIVWDSFRVDTGRPPITMAWLLKRERDANRKVDKAPPKDNQAVTLGPAPFTVVQAAEFLKRRQAIDWQIRNVLSRRSHALFFGDSGVGKSFFVTDLALHVALGLPWRGLRTKPGRVVYVVAEGKAGFATRLQAWADASGHDLARARFDVIPETPNMLTADWQALAKLIGQADLIVNDTLAATTPGANENASEDMGLYLGNALKLIEATGATLISVHHSGKDASRGARGHSSLRAAVDTEVELTRDGDLRKARMSKSRDGQDGGEWPFRLDQVVLDIDEEGEAITSCVVIPDDGTAPQAAPEPRKGHFGETLGPWEQAVWQSLLPRLDGHDVAPYKDVFEAAMQFAWDDPTQAPATQHNGRDVRKQRVKRAFEGLEKRGLVARIVDARGRTTDVKALRKDNL